MVIYCIIFIIGTIIGSFLNACIYRIPVGESIAYPPSHCVSCKSKIKWYDLLPIMSYIFLKGRCRYCEEKISIRYPAIEFITGLLFLMIYVKYDLTLDFIKYAIFISILIVIGIIDFDTTDVYFSTTLTGMIFSVIFIGIYIYNGIPIRSYIYGGILAGGLIAIIILITKGGMGWGDLEICLLCGLFLGLKLTILMLFLAFIIGSIVGVILIISGKKSRKDYIPFGPYIAIASIVCTISGEKIFSLYMSLIF